MMVPAGYSVILLRFPPGSPLPREAGALTEKSLALSLQSPFSRAITRDGRMHERLVLPLSFRLLRSCPRRISSIGHENLGRGRVAARAFAPGGLGVQHGEKRIGFDHTDKLLSSIVSMERR
jgi:hypothetical protein